MKFTTTTLLAIFSLGLVAAAPTPIEERAPQATVGWNDPNTYKNDPDKKADYEQKACNALDRAGCAGGTIMGGEHKSPAGGDPNPHVTVRPDGTQGPKKPMHVYPNGDASRKNSKGKTIHFREAEEAGMYE